MADAGTLDKYEVELIGAKLDAIKKAEDRLLFKDAMKKIGLDMPRSALINNLRDGLDFTQKIGFPCVIRPSFTLGGSGGGIHTLEEWYDPAGRSLALRRVLLLLLETCRLVTEGTLPRANSPLPLARL